MNEQRILYLFVIMLSLLFIGYSHFLRVEGRLKYPLAIYNASTVCALVLIVASIPPVITNGSSIRFGYFVLGIGALACIVSAIILVLLGKKMNMHDLSHVSKSNKASGEYIQECIFIRIFIAGILMIIIGGIDMAFFIR